MKLKFKIQSTAQVDQRPNQKGDSQTSGLTFVNIGSPAQIKEHATQRKIRRHVMKDIGRSRRRDAKYQTALSISRPLLRSAPPYWGDVKVCPNFKRLFWAMDMVSEGLLAIAVGGPGVILRRRLAQGIDDARQWEQISRQAQTLHELKQYTESLSLVRKSLITPETQTSRYAVIGSIICLAAFDMRVLDQKRWMIHMEGLQRIIQLGGGVGVLDSRSPLRQSLFLADVLGSLVHDVPPRFPRLPLPQGDSMLPDAARPPCAQKLLASLQSSDLVLPLDSTSLSVIESALSCASQLAIFLDQVWNASPMTLDLMIPVCAISHDVLSLPSLAYSNSPASSGDGISQIAPVGATAELIRSSVLALLSTVISTTGEDNLFCVSRSRQRGPIRRLLMRTGDEVWAGCEELKLWVLVIQTLMETGPSRPWFLDQITHIMSLLSLRSWDALVACLRQVAWVEKAAMDEMAQLKSDIEPYLMST